jgi:hypothetical protein
VLAQHLEVLRDRGLGDAELGPHHGGHRARGLLAGGEQLQDASADRVAEHVESVHAPNIEASTYISQT